MQRIKFRFLDKVNIKINSKIDELIETFKRSNLNSPLPELIDSQIDFYNEVFTSIDRYVENLFKNPLDDKLFYFDTTGSPKMNIIHLDNPLDLRVTKNDIPHAMHQFSQYCRLPGGEIFINGGRNSAGTFLINPTTLSISPLPTDSIKNFAALVYKKGYVYRFGGCSAGMQPFAASERFSLSTLQWSPIGNLPSPAWHVSGATIFGKIVIADSQLTTAYTYERGIYSRYLSSSCRCCEACVWKLYSCAAEAVGAYWGELEGI